MAPLNEEFWASNLICGGRVTSLIIAGIKSSGVMGAGFDLYQSRSQSRGFLVLARRAAVFLLGVPFLRRYLGFYTRWPPIFIPIFLF
jgi:hypothetical protein